MDYRGDASGDAHPAFFGISRRKSAEEPASLDEAIRAAVHASRAGTGTKFVVTYIEVETEGDPDVGAYKVIITPSGG